MSDPSIAIPSPSFSRAAASNVQNVLAIAGTVAAVLGFWIPAEAMAEHACKPVLKLNEARFLPAQNQQRRWTAIVDVDASHCTESSGLFEIKFLRLKEVGPDLLFAERFKWSLAPVEVSLDFWWDESIGDYWIGDILPCGCVN